MILSGHEIRSEVEAGRIHIDDFDPERIEPNSYGFRLADKILSYTDEVIDCYRPPQATTTRIPPEGIVLEPGRLYLGGTAEAMGSPHYAAELYACRSTSTLGIWIQFSAPLGHSGAMFPWTLEIQVAHPVRVYAGMIIGKLAFWSMQGRSVGYAGKYTGSSSAVASRLALDAPAGDCPEVTPGRLVAVAGGRR